ncbi:hypothetical protein L0668_16095 [Paraglaciecola aquimarina]|uniref:Uncharacterized protein n=1 Tax=Paraglaciecola algarum TaxID=3050085 RepID=A0ABS9DCX5_9ALTE|nr:hypothetical protein [Paraglaciecola sp. G1-23]MCF2949644.1 hypothetical protein [Paraglaciecola sp. G1-23]
MKSPLTTFLGLVFAAWFIVLQQLPLGEIQSDYIETFPTAGITNNNISNDSLSKPIYLANHELPNVQFSKVKFLKANLLVDGNIDLTHVNPLHAFQYFTQEDLTPFITSYDSQVLVAYIHQYNQTLLFEVFSILDSTAYQLQLDEVTART